jgi:hypothetical protein
MKDFFKSLLGESNKASMMRFGTFVILGIITFFAIILGIMLIKLGWNCSDTLNNLNFWGGISIFIGTLLLNGGVFLGIKAYQKKYETTNINPFTKDRGNIPDNNDSNITTG